MANLTNDDQGKHVVNSNGDTVGMISKVEGNTAHVDPDPGITDKIRSTLGWEDKDADEYALTGDHISEITNDEVRLKH